MSGSTETNPEDQREHPRFAPFVVQCRITFDGDTISAYILNLSPGGALIAWPAKEPPPSEARLTIVAHFQSAKTTVRLPGRVAWSRVSDDQPGTALIGVSFPDLPVAERQVVEEVLGDFKSKAALLADAEAMGNPDTEPPFRRAEWTRKPIVDEDWLALMDDELLYQIGRVGARARRGRQAGRDREEQSALLRPPGSRKEAERHKPPQAALA